MEESVYLLYECDAWLSRDSMVLMGIFTSEEKLLNGVRELVLERLDDGDSYYFDEDNEDEEFLDIANRVADEFLRYYQTQNYEVNFYATTATLDKLEEI